MCLTHFLKLFKSGGKRQTIDADDEEETEEIPQENESENAEKEEVDKFHFMIERDASKGKELPRIIKLNSAFPKETPFIHKRKHPAALYFHKVNKNNNPYKHFLYELQM
jgi:hypothetical protein